MQHTLRERIAAATPDEFEPRPISRDYSAAARHAEVKCSATREMIEIAIAGDYFPRSKPTTSDRPISEWPSTKVFRDLGVDLIFEEE